LGLAGRGFLCCDRPSTGTLAAPGVTDGGRKRTAGLGPLQAREARGHEQKKERAAGPGALGHQTVGLKPLAFDQFGEMGPGLEALLGSVAKRGADEMAYRSKKTTGALRA
jgi:hypothetical protein